MPAGHAPDLTPTPCCAGEPGAPEAVWLAVHIALRRFDDLRAAFQAALQVCAGSGGSLCRQRGWHCPELQSTWLAVPDRWRTKRV